MTYDPSDLSVDDLLNGPVGEAILTELASGEPYYVISGSGTAWYLDPESRQVVQIPRGTEIVPIDKLEAGPDRILVRAPNRFLLIPHCEIQEIGWN